MSCAACGRRRNAPAKLSGGSEASGERGGSVWANLAPSACGRRSAAARLLRVAVAGAAAVLLRAFLVGERPLHVAGILGVWIT
jgi:hypothetical protein